MSFGFLNCFGFIVTLSFLSCYNLGWEVNVAGGLRKLKTASRSDPSHLASSSHPLNPVIGQSTVQNWNATPHQNNGSTVQRCIHTCMHTYIHIHTYITIHYNTIQIRYNTIQYKYNTNTIQYKYKYQYKYNTIQYNTIQYNTYIQYIQYIQYIRTYVRTLKKWGCHFWGMPCWMRSWWQHVLATGRQRCFRLPVRPPSVHRRLFHKDWEFTWFLKYYVMFQQAHGTYVDVD